MAIAVGSSALELVYVRGRRLEGGEAINKGDGAVVEEEELAGVARNEALGVRVVDEGCEAGPEGVGVK